MFEDGDAPDDLGSPSFAPGPRATRVWSPQDRRPPGDWVERRLVPRSVTLEYRSLLGWWDGGEFEALAARMLDLSLGGVAVETVAPVPRDRDVLFCLIPGPDRDCVAGEVAEIGRGTKGRYLVRLAFWTPCPARLFAAAVRGVAAGENPGRQPGSR